MSQFLEEFAALLSTVTRDATFARAWKELLPKVCHHAGEHWDAGGLWLVDRDDGVTRLTLWHWWHETGVKDLPFYVSTQLPDQKTDHIDNNTLIAMVRKASEQLSANGLLPHSHSIHLAKIEVPADSGVGHTTLGALSLFSTNGQPLDATVTRDLGIAGATNQCGVKRLVESADLAHAGQPLCSRHQPGRLQRLDLGRLVDA